MAITSRLTNRPRPIRTTQMPLSVACDVWALRIGAGSGRLTTFEIEDGAKDPVTDTVAVMVALATYDRQRDIYVFDAGSHVVYAQPSITHDTYLVHVKPKERTNE